jgi:hypothetical protein
MHTRCIGIGTLRGMPRSAPRIDRRLVAALALLDDGATSFAEINRRLGQLAAQFGLFKPSYEQVRVLVHATRARLGRRPCGMLRIDVSIRLQPPAPLLGSSRLRYLTRWRT